jgi:histidine triad (HIT) family protein
MSDARSDPRFDPSCIFCKIVRGEIPCNKAYEDERVLAFHDIRPQAPVHLLIIPKSHVATLYDAAAQDEPALGRMMAIAGRLAREAGAADGFRTIVNTGRVGHQEVYHVHMHVLGGPQPLGPMLQRSHSQGK